MTTKWNKLLHHASLLMSIMKHFTISWALLCPQNGFVIISCVHFSGYSLPPSSRDTGTLSHSGSITGMYVFIYRLRLLCASTSLSFTISPHFPFSTYLSWFRCPHFGISIYTLLLREKFHQKKSTNVPKCPEMSWYVLKCPTHVQGLTWYHVSCEKIWKHQSIKRLVLFYCACRGTAW